MYLYFSVCIYLSNYRTGCKHFLFFFHVAVLVGRPKSIHLLSIYLLFIHLIYLPSCLYDMITVQLDFLISASVAGGSD